MPTETLEKPKEMPSVPVPDCPLTLDMMEQAQKQAIVWSIFEASAAFGKPCPSNGIKDISFASSRH